jgi:adenylate cyclase class 2
MNIEIEAKLKVDSHGPIAEKLDSAGAEFTGTQKQTDRYFDDAAGSLLASDKCLRIRTTISETSEKTYLTVKGPKQKTNLKKRTEIELPISDPTAAEELLNILGFSQKLVVEKDRKFFRLNDCLIQLDTLPGLGCFVEIEGPNEQIIAEVQKNLGLEDLKHITDSYAHLVANEIKRTKS